MSFGLPIGGSEQALTAARPSRISTAFPFDYPEAHDPGTCHWIINFSKNKQYYYKTTK